MDTSKAIALSFANRDREPMVFDWQKAARIIKERKAKTASAGLQGDWEWTGGKILKDGEPINRDETYTYLASTWAVPELDIDGDVIPCFLMQSEAPGWGSDTFWPEEAIKILSE